MFVRVQSLKALILVTGKHNLGAGETAQQLEALTAIGEDLGLVFSTPIVAHTCP